MFNQFIKSIFKDSGLKEEGFVHDNKRILLSPVSDFIKGYSFNKIDNHCYVHLFVVPVYAPLSHLPLTYGWRLVGSHKYRDMFFLDEQNLEYTRNEIMRLIEESKKILLSINTPMDFYNRFKEHDKVDKLVDTLRHKETMTYTLCYAGHTDCSRSIDDALQYWEQSDRKQLPWMQEIAANLQKLKKACKNDGDREKLFTDWKAYTIKNLRLEKFYLQKNNLI